MRKILKTQIRMVCDAKADRTIIVGLSIIVVMKCTPQNGDRKTNEED